MSDYAQLISVRFRKFCIARHMIFP